MAGEAESQDVSIDALSSELQHALVLFDWTVRHLQLDNEVSLNGLPRLNSNVILYAWENLMMGRGTMAEKSRVFLLLARQLGLPVVILAIDRPDDDEPARPWLPALLHQGELYLFDMRLGIPVPGPVERGIACLSEVLADPTLLDSLEVFPDFLYPVDADDLNHVVALIDATPAFLSERMQILEGGLVGDQKTVLTTSPTPLASTLRGCDGIQAVAIWTLPYQGFAIRSQLQANPTGVVALALEHSLFDRRTPLLPARVMQFRGQLENTEDRPGARTLYLECRAPDEQIRQLTQIPLPTSPGPEQEAPSPEAQRRMPSDWPICST